ncbi:MAG TPA: hypothetical protein VFQ38_14990 [Longimicrobiales bacterium]|nr:hypothetical protein [Longimicrobiales bacterium]
MNIRSRITLTVVSLSLLLLYLVPLWSIRLQAPQYPEGLGMKISLHTIVGRSPHDLQSINGLNHYIGMKPITPDAIPELRWMPWIVAFLVGFGLLAAVVGRRGLLYAWAGSFIAVALAGLYDFWRWTYDYGHNLSPNAIIKIPGMAYQPPLLGTKQLLNFTATSLPDVGGIIAFVAVAAGVTMTVLELRETGALRLVKG